MTRVHSLLDVDADAWERLAGSLRATGLDGAYLSRVLRVGERVDDAMRAPMRLWTLRRSREAAARAARMLMFGDPVTVTEATTIVGDIEPWVDAGLLARTGEGIVSRFCLHIAYGKFFLADDLKRSGDAVMGPSAPTLYTCLAARPAARVETLLDVGCGAGTIALALADRATHVVATDLSARALVLAEVNARLNGVRNVEFRRGDLFEPARESFDLIVSQPPFVACTPGETDASFLHGGARGDELALRLLAHVGAHLNEGGRAFVLVDWPVIDGDTIEERVRGVTGESMNVLVAASPARNLEDHCTLHAALAHADLGAEFTHTAMAMRDHLEAQRVQSLRMCVTVLERAARGWVSLAAVGHFADAPPNRASLDRLFRSRALTTAEPDVLLDAPLRATGARVEGPVTVPDGPALVVVRPARDQLLLPTSVEARIAGCAERVSQAGTARAVGAAASDVRAAIVCGLLEPVE